MEDKDPQQNNTEQKKEQPLERFVVGVQHRRAGKIYSFITTDPTLTVGDLVVVEADNGTTMASVASPPQKVAEDKPINNLKNVLRKAGDEDIAAEAKRREQSLEYFEICRNGIARLCLPMKLVDAEIAEGGRKVIFTFFAEQRVDFRSLVKEMAGTLRMRIEMRQIGSRDEAKHIGCLGPCGFPTCCSTHLRQFQSISISMAKGQGLTPNPTKLTGMCGKLRCCVAYEYATYEEFREGLPKTGTAVGTPAGAGKITGHNVLKKECIVRLYAGGETRFPCSECEPLSAKARDEAIAAARRAQEEAEEDLQRRRQRTLEGGKRVNDNKRKDRSHGKEG